MKITEREAIKVVIKDLTEVKQPVEDAADSFFYQLRTWPKKQEENKTLECLHRMCKDCRFGIKDHVHMISCPCRSCSPWM